MSFVKIQYFSLRSFMSIRYRSREQGCKGFTGFNVLLIEFIYTAVKFFKGCLPEILHDLFLNTLSQMK